MAENVIKMKKESEDTEKKVESFVVKYRKTIIIAIIAIVAAACVVAGVIGAKESAKNKAIEAIDQIEFTFTKNSDELSDEEASARQTAALESLKAYTGRKDAAGVRANLLAAEISKELKDFAAVKDFNVSAAKAMPKAYTAGIAYFNAASACEELGSFEDALKYYEEASKVDGFDAVCHAIFNTGRVQETLKMYSEAVATYQILVDKYTGDEWANLARSRIVTLKAKGLAE